MGYDDDRVREDMADMEREDMRDHIDDLESRLADAERQRDEARSDYAKWEKRADGYAEELDAANERLAGVVAALERMTVGHFHDSGHCALRPDIAIASCEAVNIARQALSAAGAEVVKGFAEDFDPGVKGYPHTVAIVWTDHAEGRVPCYIVTLKKEAVHEEG